MPLSGEQHRANGAATNPFEPAIPRITEYTAKELATLQSRLDKQLGPEYISSRTGAGGNKVHYITAGKVIDLANEVFGFNGWSSQIQNVQVDFVDENPQTGKVSLGLSTTLRVTLKDGTFHEDLGYGMVDNCKGKGPAFEKAKKEAVSDAIKRAMRNFGSVLGNCLYDKDYVGKITKVKAVPNKWDEDNLHRHPDFVPPKKGKPSENALENEQHVQPNKIEFADYNDMDDEFGMDILDEVDINNVNPDDVSIPPGNGPPTPQMTLPRNASEHPSAAPIQPGLGSNTKVNGVNGGFSSRNNTHQPSSHINQLSNPPVGFITSRAAEALTGPDAPPPNLANLPKFNPNADSPSIRKTTGINHATSAPVTRSIVQGGAASNAATAPPTNQPVPPGNDNGGNKTSTTGVVNPAEGMQRKIGAPPAGIGSPHSNRGMYKPPTMVAGIKRPLTPTAAVEGASASRAPLSDISNAAPAPALGQSDLSGEDAKRAKIADA